MAEPQEKDNLNTYAVSFMFPELKGAGIYQGATVRASEPGTAFNRAWHEVKQNPAIKGRRITTIKATIIRSEKNVEES